MAVFNFKIKAQNTIKIKLNYFGNPAPVIATYLYRLKTKDSNKSVEEFSGDNQNSDDDIFSLPVPLSENKNKYIIISNEISAFNANSGYSIQIEIIQDDVVTDTFEDKGEVVLNEPSHGKTILIRME